MKEDKAFVAYEKIKKSIMSGELRGDMPLSETFFAEKLHMSRTPIRTALQRLQNEDFIRIIPKQGIVIKEITMDEAIQLFDLRTAIERYLIGTSISLLDESDFETMRDFIRKQKTAMETKDYDRFLELDEQFHVYCYHHYNNEYMINIINNYRERFYSWRYQAIKITGRMEASIAEHERFLELISQNKTQEACDLLEHHVGTAIRLAQSRMPVKYGTT